MDNKNIIYVENRKVHCENLEDGSGHPRVYLEIKGSQIACPYCSKIFKLKSWSYESNQRSKKNSK